MDKQYIGVLIAIALAGCTTSYKEETEQMVSNSEIHFIPNHGVKNIPVSVIPDGNQTHLFYTTEGNEWGHAVSSNLLHWSEMGLIEVPSKEMGLIEVPSKEMGDIVLHNTEWFSVFQSKDAVKAFSSKDLESWNEVDLKIAGNTKGVPKINKTDQNWVMTITNEDSIAFYKSINLEEWMFVNKVSNGYNSEYSELITSGNTAFLVANGGETYFEVDTFRDGYQIVGTPTPYLNNAKGTFFRKEKVDYAILSFNEKVFSIPLEVSHLSKKLILSPSRKVLKSEMIDRKRGRLEFLFGGYPCIFSFSLDPTVTQAEILLTNQFEENATLQFKALNSTQTELRIDGILESYSYAFNKEKSSPIEIDIIIDYSIIELFINNGEAHFVESYNSKNILDRILITADGKKWSPPASLIRINGKTTDDQ